MNMTQEEKLQLVKEWYNNPSTSEEEKSLLKKFVPELSICEDERIRKEIVEYIKIQQRVIKDEGHIHQANDIEKWLVWLEKQGEKTPEVKAGQKFKADDYISIVDRYDGKWVRVCAYGEDFIIAAHDYKDDDKTEFTWGKACEIGTFNKKQGYIMLILKDEINARLEEIGGEPLDSSYWSSSEYSDTYAWFVNFHSDYVYNNVKYGSSVVRRVAAF